MKPPPQAVQTGGTLTSELCYLGSQTALSAAWLSALTSGLVAIGAALGAFSWRLDLFTHFVPGAFVLGVAAAIVGAFMERRRLKWSVIVGLTGALIALVLMAPELSRSAQRPAPIQAGGERLTVVQLNLSGRNPDPRRAARWLKARNADIVVLEEAGNSPILERLKDVYPHQITCTHPRPCAPMILLKRPPHSNGGSAVPPEANAAWVTFDGPDGFTIMGVHQFKPWDPDQRRQIELLTGRAGQFDPRRLIIVGDFNSTPWSWSMRRQDEALGIERRTRALATWPAWAPIPLLPIDHVYAGEDWRVVDIRRGPKVGSDHYPVVTTLARAQDVK